MTHEELINSQEYKIAKIEIWFWSKRKLFYFVLFYLFLSFFVGCKTKEKIVEKIEYRTDSIEIVNLKSYISSKENQIYSLSEQLRESRKDNERLQSNTSYTVKEFDTDKPNAPLKKETVYNQSNEAEKETKIDTQKETSLISKIEKLEFENSELNKKVTFLENEKKDLKLEKKSESKFQWWLMLIGFAGGLLFYFYFGRIVYLIKINRWKKI